MTQCVVKKKPNSFNNSVTWMLPFLTLQNVKLFVAKNRASSSVLSNSMDTPIHVASRLDSLLTFKDFIKVLIAHFHRRESRLSALARTGMGRKYHWKMEMEGLS